MTEQMEISQVRGNLSELASRASSGEEIVLTRYGKPICRLAPLSLVQPIPTFDKGTTPKTYARPMPAPDLPPPPPSGKYDQHKVDQMLRGVNRQKSRK